MTNEELRLLDSGTRRDITAMLRSTEYPEQLAKFIMESLEFSRRYLSPDPEEFAVVATATRETLEPFMKGSRKR